jgi:hypothetical protein
LIQKIKNFWINSYTSDKTAFYVEMFSAVLTVSGSLTLALHARQPDMTVVYPMFFLGSVSQVIAAYRRGAAWVMVLTFYFSCANIFGYCVAKGWI